MLTHLSLFSGIGGLDLAAEWAGFQTVGQCEFAEHQTKVLEKHWPDIPRWKDVRNFTAKSFRQRTGLETATCISGGFPCQPHSLAGERKASDDERDLWPEYRRIISEIRPRWVVAENVPGLLSSEDGRFFRGILRDLSELGFDVGWCTYPAAWVGAPHRRDRVFTIAHTNSIRFSWRSRPSETDRNRKGNNEIRCDSGFEAANEIMRYLSNPASAPKDIRSDYGFSDWAHRLKEIGNAVVPQQAYPIFRSIADIESGAL